jgi:hypothetical protein
VTATAIANANLTVATVRNESTSQGIINP